MMHAITHNLTNQQNPVIKVVATPYYPTVIAAINRIDQQTKHLPEDEFQSSMDQQFQEDLGLFIDWKAHRLVDGRGYYIKTIQQVDTLTFLLSISNTSWPCVSPMYFTPTGIFPMFRSNDFPCYMPDISHLEQNVYLVNARGDSIRAMRVSGRRMNTLGAEETVIAKFAISNVEPRFLEGVEIFYLVVSGFERPLSPVKLEFDLETMKASFAQF